MARHCAVARLVFIAALLPRPGWSVAVQFTAEPEMEVPSFTYTEDGDGLLSISDDVALRAFYHDLPPPIAAA